jgi:hypothetical protein
MKSKILINLFGGAKEIFSICLGKSNFKAGETVRGKLLVSTNKDIKARNIGFLVEGKEEALIVGQKKYYQFSRGMHSFGREIEEDAPYSVSDTFFKEDLSAVILSNTSFITRLDKEITIIKGKHEIPFEFAVPSNTLSSYYGKIAWIKYTARVIVDKKLKGDLNKSISFDVIDAGILSENFSSGPIFVTGRNNKGLEVRLDVDKSVYKRGDLIKGGINIQNADQDIREIKVILTAKEYATASGKTETAIIEESPIALQGGQQKDICLLRCMFPKRYLRVLLESILDYIGKLRQRLTCRWVWMLLHHPELELSNPHL